MPSAAFAQSWSLRSDDLSVWSATASVERTRTALSPVGMDVGSLTAAYADSGMSMAADRATADKGMNLFMRTGYAPAVSFGRIPQ